MIDNEKISSTMLTICVLPGAPQVGAFQGLLANHRYINTGAIYSFSMQSCSRQSGNNVPGGATSECSVEDACAPGWHVCATSKEVADRGGCGGAETTYFWATQQSGYGGNTCSMGTVPCTVASTSCASSSESRNDIFGCSGSNAYWYYSSTSQCGALNFASGNLCEVSESKF